MIRLRAQLGLVLLIVASACGHTEHQSPAAMPSSGGGGASGLAGTAGLAGTGGLAGMGGSSQVASAVTECEQFCETLDYRLPQALCEDWNRPGWEPPFCDLEPRASCADYCREVYEAVSPTCAESLQPVMRCVAPSYASGVITSCWLADCRFELFNMTSACYGLREKLAAARATWAASGVVDYRLTYDGENGGKADVVVREGSEPVVTPTDAIAWTVPKLFDEVERTLNEPGVAPIVLYDAKLGYVVALARQEGCSEGSTVVNDTEVAP